MSRYQTKSQRKLAFTDENMHRTKPKIEEGFSKRNLAKGNGNERSNFEKSIEMWKCPTVTGKE